MRSIEESPARPEACAAWRASACVALSLVISVTASCGDESRSASPADDEGDEAGDARVDGPLPTDECPAGASLDGICLPEAPQLEDWVCPEGWLSVPALVDERGADVSDGLVAPFDFCLPPRLPSDCEPGTMAVVGSSDCEPVGSACPPPGALWPDEEALRRRAPEHAGVVRYVEGRGEPGGSGRRDDPFGTLAEAVQSASDGDIVALARGSYATPITLQQGLALLGACPAETVLASDAGPEFALVVAAGGALVADLGFTGPRRGLQVVPIDQSVTLRSLIVVGAVGNGLAIDAGSGRVHLERILVRGVDPGEGRAEAPGILVTSGLVEIQTATVTEASGLGVAAMGGDLTLRDAVVAETRDNTSGPWRGLGLVCVDGSRLVVERAAFLQNRLAGLGVLGGELQLTDAFVADTRAIVPERAGGYGLVAGSEQQTQTGPLVRLTRAVFHNNRGAAIGTVGLGTRLLASDLAVLDTRLELGDNDGTAINVLAGARAEIERALLRGNSGAGVYVQSREGRPAAELTLTDALVADTSAGDWLSRAGTGVYVGRGAHARVERLIVLRSHDAGVLALGEGTSLELRDVQVLDTRPRPDGRHGRALEVTRGARATVLRGVFRGAYDVGVHSGMPGSRLEAEHIVVSGVRTAADGSSGVGVLVFDYADLLLGQFVVEESAFIGIQVARRGWLAGSDGVVRGNYVGLNAQEPASDLRDTLERVRVEGNEIDFDYSVLPVPALRNN
jgi:hypothetical protein